MPGLVGTAPLLRGGPADGARPIRAEEYGVYNESYFRIRSKQEFARSKRYALPFSMLLVSVGDLSRFPVERQVVFLRVLSRMLNGCVREIDVVAKTSFVEAPFAVLLMTATPEPAGVLRARLLESYRRLGLGVELRVGVGTYQAKMEKSEELVAQAQADIG